MSDEAIAQALDAPLNFSPDARVALFHLNHQSARPWGWAGHMNVQAGTGPEEIMPKMASSLSRVKGIRDLAPIPTFVIPPEKNLGHLRQAAARIQADLIWVYSSRCLLTEHHPLFFDSEAEAVCTAEAVLVDVRTGLIPFSSRASQTVRQKAGKKVKGGKAELSFARTRHLAEQAAVDRAMAENARNLQAFMAEIPAMGAGQSPEILGE
jgi:hypothetical protein